MESVPTPMHPIFTDASPPSNTGDDESSLPSSPLASDGESDLTGSPASYHSCPQSPRSYGILANLNSVFSTSSPSISRSSPQSSCDSLLGGSRAYSDPGHSYGDHPHPSVRTTCVAYASTTYCSNPTLVNKRLKPLPLERLIGA